MNTSGYIRGYMAKNMKAEDFIKVVVSALNREFEEIKEGVSLEYKDKEFIISMGKYQVVMSKELIDKLKSPYGIDKYILEEFEKQGFTFERNRSQYIQYCFGDYVGAHII